MNGISDSRTAESAGSGGWPIWAMAGSVAVLALGVSAGMADARASLAASAVCGGSPVAAVLSGEEADEEVVIDVSLSTAARALREEYRQVALSIVERAAADGSAARIVVFGSSGVGARVVFSGSFRPVSPVLVFNLAEANRLRCLAEQALERALAIGTRESGTDLAGAVAAAVASGRQVVKPGEAVTVTVLSDGCQAPSRSGPNRSLTDLCGKLARGVSPQRILARAGDEFSFGDARGVTVTMKGVGVGRSRSAASTGQARRLVAFWRLICLRARASACVIGSAVL